jgi:tol-pal system protein YbgF
MNNLRTTRLLLLAPLLALSGCELLQPRGEDPVLVKLNELERRLAAIERVVQNQSLVNMTQQVSSLERRSDEQRGRIEELEHHASTTAERQRDLYIDIDARIQELETVVRARTPSVLEGGTLSPGQLPVPGGSDRDNYQAAFELLKDQRYEPAAMAFEQFLKSYPNSDLADNAQYWLAETHYVGEEFEQALKGFNAVLERYPDSRKIPDALLKIGYCNIELERPSAAEQALSQVVGRYPDSSAARLATQRLEQLRKEAR